MIEICVNAPGGEGGLVSLCHVVNGLKMCEDTYKIIVIDDDNTIDIMSRMDIQENNHTGTNALIKASKDLSEGCQVIYELNKKNLVDVINSNSKVILVENVFRVHKNLNYINIHDKLMELISDYNAGCNHKIYYIWKNTLVS